MKHTVNPVAWAAIGCIFGATLALIAHISGNPMPQTVMAAGMGGLFWGWMAALIRNKLAH